MVCDTVNSTYDEEAQTPPGVTDVDRTELTPVHLGTFPRRKGQGQERWRAFRWPHDTQVVAQDRDTASVALFAQLPVDLYGAVGVAFKQALDDRFIGIELASARLRLPLSEVCLCQPVDNRAYIQAKLPCDLRRAELVACLQVMDSGVSVVINHGRAPSSDSTW